MQDSENDLLAVLRAHTDFDRPAQHRHHRSTGITHPKYGLTRSKVFETQPHSERATLALDEIRKQKAPRKDPPCAFEPIGQHHQGLRSLQSGSPTSYGTNRTCA